MTTASTNSPDVQSRKPSEIALQNHKQLFPNHKSTLQVTDPELIEIFDNFAFDEAWQENKLETKSKVMIILAALIGCQSLREYKIMVGAALNVGVTAIEIKEILYQSVPYVGMARAFDFVHVTNEIFVSSGIGLPLDSQSTTNKKNRLERGLELQKTIFGDMIDQLYKNSPRDQLHIQQFLSANCFGDYYTRNGMKLQCRELITLSILIGLGGVDSQIKGHIQGNLNIGNNRTILNDLITLLLPWVGYPRTLNALKCLNEVSTIPPSMENS